MAEWVSVLLTFLLDCLFFTFIFINLLFLFFPLFLSFFIYLSVNMIFISCSYSTLLYRVEKKWKEKDVRIELCKDSKRECVSLFRLLLLFIFFLFLRICFMIHVSCGEKERNKAGRMNEWQDEV